MALTLSTWSFWSLQLCWWRTEGIGAGHSLGPSLRLKAGSPLWGEGMGAGGFGQVERVWWEGDRHRQDPGASLEGDEFRCLHRLD